jgi:hypothetical protein
VSQRCLGESLEVPESRDSSCNLNAIRVAHSRQQEFTKIISSPVRVEIPKVVDLGGRRLGAVEEEAKIERWPLCIQLGSSGAPTL